MPHGYKLLFIAAAFPAAAGAQVDRYGRDIGDDRLLPASMTAEATTDARTFAARSLDRGAFTLLPYVATRTGSWPDAVAIGDVTHDRRADVVLSTSFYFDPVNDYNVFVFPQRPFNGTLGTPTQIPFGQQATRTGLALGDFDGHDGLDVAVGGNSGVSILSATNAPPWLSLGSVVQTQSAMAVGALDLQGDGKTDLVSVSWGTGGNTYLNNGYGQFTPANWNVAVAGWNSLAVGDLDGDGVDDVAVASGTGAMPNVRLQRNNGNGTLTQFGALDGECGGWQAKGIGIGIGDLDGDKHNDIVVSAGGNGSSACLLVYRGDGNGQFASPLRLASYDIPETLAVADINLDGRKDVTVVHGGWMRVGVYLQQADGTLAPEMLFPIPYASHYGSQGLAVGDFTGDSCPDVAIADYNNGLVTLANGMWCPRKL